MVSGDPEFDMGTWLTYQRSQLSKWRLPDDRLRALHAQLPGWRPEALQHAPCEVVCTQESKLESERQECWPRRLQSSPSDQPTSACLVEERGRATWGDGCTTDVRTCHAAASTRRSSACSTRSCLRGASSTRWCVSDRRRGNRCWGGCSGLWLSSSGCHADKRLQRALRWVCGCKQKVLHRNQQLSLDRARSVRVAKVNHFRFVKRFATRVPSALPLAPGACRAVEWQTLQRR